MPPRLKATLNKIGGIVSEDGLIQVDHKVILLVAICVVLFGLLVAFMIHGSSYPMWHTYIPDVKASDEGVFHCLTEVSCWVFRDPLF